MIEIRQYDVWIADLGDSEGTEPGKKRPVVVIQSDVLNKFGHSSTVICLISSQVRTDVTMLRIELLPDGINGLKKESFVLCDQIRSIDNKRLLERVGKLREGYIENIKNSLKAVLSIY